MKEFLSKKLKTWKKLQTNLIKFIKYSRFFYLWSVFKLLDPDPDLYISRRANNIRIRLDPDPQQWSKHLRFYSKVDLRGVLPLSI